MIDHFLSPPKRPKLKLICSFNGTFQPRPPSGKLKYTGGETRIISVDRNIGFSKLKSKISDLICFPNKNPSSFSLKYHLPDSDSVAGNTHLVIITSDDDVRCMIYAYEKIESYGKHCRLWIFVCNDDFYVNGHIMNADFSGNFVRTEKLSNRFCKNSGFDGFNGQIMSTDFSGNLSNGFCKNSGFDGFNEQIMSTDFSGNLSNELCKNSGFDGGKKGIRVKSHVESVCGNRFESGTHLWGGRASDDSLRKMVLKQQLLAKQLGRLSSFRGGLGLGIEQTEMQFANENEKYDHPLIDFTSMPESPLSHETINLNFVGDYLRVNTLDNKYTNARLGESQNFGNLVPYRVSHSHPLNPMDGNLRVDSNSSIHGLSGQSHLSWGNRGGISSGCSGQFIAARQFPNQSCCPNRNRVVGGYNSKHEFRNGKPASLSNMNRENIMPWGVDCNEVRTGFAPLSSSNQLLGSVCPIKSSNGGEKTRDSFGICRDSFQSGIRSHRFGLSDARYQRTFPHHIRNHRSTLTEMANHRNVRLDGRSWVGKYYPGLRLSSNISKQGQSMRSYHPTSWKPSSSSHHHKLEGVVRTTDCCLNTCSNAVPYGSQENLSEQGSFAVPQYGKPNPKKFLLAYNGAHIGIADQSLLPLNTPEITSPCTQAAETQIDLLTGPGSERHEVPYQTLCRNLLEVCCDVKKEPCMMDQQEVGDITDFPINTGYSNGTGFGCNGKLSDIEAGSFSNHQKLANTLQGGITSSVNLSLHNLSLSSSKEVEPRTSSSAASSDVSKALLKPQSKHSDLMDEVHFSSGPLFEKSSGVASISSSHNAAKMEKDNNQKTEIQQEPQSRLSIDEKEFIKKTHECSKANGGIPTELSAFYAHIATRELQTIKNSDLDNIKEIGSGTYGTVFYGKWKGSDVAIKRIKPSCFAEGAVDEDRLVADFWKEAHILGQLHHPNIVALYGVVTDGPVTNLATVTEYMVNGSLKQVLRRKDRTIDRRKRLIIAMDAAFGMEYLHEKNIVHFDLKSHNFLVNMRDPQRPVCKIGDLGLSKIKQKTLVSGGLRGTIPWMAPELLSSKNMVTEKVDVYSFGIVMWELLMGEEPYANMRSEEIIAGIIKGNLRPEIPSWCDPAWRSLMERCWSSNPDARPPFSEIAKELRAMAAAMNIK